MRWICASVLAGLLSACAAIERENSSNEPIPPARPDPFGGFGSSAPPPESGGSAPVGN